MPQQKPPTNLSLNIETSAPKKPVGRQLIYTERQIKLIDPVWCHGRVPSGFWQDDDNQRNYLLWLAHKLHFRSMKDWYRITGDDFDNNHGCKVLSYHRCSVSEVLRHFYPEYEWYEWLFVRVPKGFWPSVDNHRRFLKWLEEKLGIRRWEDWYQVINKDVYRHHGHAFLLRYYNDSIFKMLTTLCPGHNWKPWLFAQVPKNFWNRRENRRDYIIWLGEQLAIQKPEDWYRVECRDFRQHRGACMLQWYHRRHGSVATALKDIFPEYPWEEFARFNRVKSGFYMVRANRLRYLRWLGQRLGIQKPEDWYEVTGEDFMRNHGSACLFYYHGCPAQAAMDLHSKYPWKEWLFVRLSTGFWTVPENQRRYMAWLGEQLGFRRPEDWYRVRHKDFGNYYGGGLLKYYGNMSNLLRHLLPDLDWDWLSSGGHGRPKYTSGDQTNKQVP